MAMMETIRCPADVRALAVEKLPQLAAEVRKFLIDTVTRTGGHLGPNLGVVELTIALHRVFDSPRDRILWDTGHQAYVHKMLTGRWQQFDRLRQRGGLSGYPSQIESEHDVIENSHASTSLSYAAGLSKGYRLQNLDRGVVAVIGDGALTGGMAWEAMNNIAADPDVPLVIVVNDNGRSYAPTVGGLATHLQQVRTSFAEGNLCQVMFTNLGLGYLGPVDGHDVDAVQAALEEARRLGGPVVVHCITQKGRGYAHAENHEGDRFHAVPITDVETGLPVTRSAPSWTSVFASELVRLGEQHPEVVALTAAMLEPTGLAEFARRFPDRVFDVGIAEQHAVTSAAGLSMAGLRPIVAIYATFLNRAFDQVLMDVAMHNCPVVFVLDRAGITGEDGASHNGMWDISLLHMVPRLRIAAPRDGLTMGRALDESMKQAEGPCVVRFPKGAIGPALPTVAERYGMDILRESGPSDVLIVSVGALAGVALEAADLLAAQGLGVTVVDPLWMKPINEGLPVMAESFGLVVTIEDGLRCGGFGTSLAQLLDESDVAVPVLNFGVPRRFLDHGKRVEVLQECGLTPSAISRSVLDRMSRLAPAQTVSVAR
jgi:1-deoxy-D-xylulose-5-phosphate synthase